MADQNTVGASGPSSSSAATTVTMSHVITSNVGIGMREYRKGNWTLQETMILIEAKKMDDERRLKRTSTTFTHNQQQQQEIAMLLMMRNTTTPTTTTTSTSGSSSKSSAAGELRWKWVEDYCWRRGCFRSQNQCNDKWDNLMRDYKKVRDFQRNLILNNHQQQQQSYWNMEKNDRKERGLPSNMLPTIYDALVQVVENKSSSSTAMAVAVTTAPSPVSASASALLLPPPPSATTSGALSLLLQQQQQHQQQQMMSATLAFLPPPPYQTAPKTIPGDSLLDSDTSSDSPAKRRRKEKRPAEASAAGGHDQPSVATAGIDIGSAMCKITEAIEESEKRQDERHKEMMILKQRRLEIEESRNEVNRQGMSGLVDCINTLANSILALAAAAAPPPPPPS